MKIIIVDDNEENLYMLQSLLKGKGHETFPACDGIEALDLIKSSMAEMIISDILMPNMDGFQLCRAVRGIENLKNIPFVFYTATYTSDKDRDFALSLGADGFFIKPDDLEMLVKMIADVIPTTISAAEHPLGDEMEFFRQHNKALFRKLEKKVADLDRAKQTLQTSVQQMSAILDNIPDMAWLKDTESRFIAVNEPLGKACGRDLQDIVGKTDLDIWPQDLANLYRHDDRDVMRTKQRKCVEERLISPDGKETWLETIKTPVINLEGNIIGTTGIARDITERRLSEEKLRKASEEWRTTFNSTSDLFFLIDKNYRITQANQAVSAFLKLPLDNVIGNYCYELMHGKTNPLPECPLSRLRRSMKHEDAEFYLEVQNIWVQETVDPVLDEKGELLEVVHIIRNITERKRLEDQLRQAQKMEAIGTLAGGIAHDFNNILSAILGFSELCLYDADPGSPLYDNLRQVLHAGHRAKDLVRQILAFSRRGERDLKPIEPAVIVKEALKLLRSTLPTTIEIAMQIDSRSLIMGDPTQIHQIVMNLCTNAAYAMEKNGGVMTIRLTDKNVEVFEDCGVHLVPGPYLQFTVADSGEGIAPEHLQSIFEPYFSTKPEGEGTGLGLAVVHGIVHSCGGDIRVHSEPGKGTVFDVFLPIFKRAALEDQNEKWKLTGGTEKLLFVDDEPTIALMVRQQLERLGYRVDIKTDSREALELFKKRHADFDLVITDMTMPCMSGDKLAQEMLIVSPKIPIILCTGFSKQMSEQRAVQIGIKALAIKPLVGAELAQLVRNVLDEAGKA